LTDDYYFPTYFPSPLIPTFLYQLTWQLNKMTHRISSLKKISKSLYSIHNSPIKAKLYALTKISHQPNIVVRPSPAILGSINNYIRKVNFCSILIFSSKNDEKINI